MGHRGQVTCSPVQFPIDFSGVTLFGVEVPGVPTFQVPFQIHCILKYIHAAITDFIAGLLRPVIGLPTMRSDGGALKWLVWTDADPNQNVWGELINLTGTAPSFYWYVVVPLSFVVLLLATGFTAMRAGTLSRRQAKRQFRRLGIAFLTIFFWLPIASTALKFFEMLSYGILLLGISDTTCSTPGGGPFDYIGTCLDSIMELVAATVAPILVGGGGAAIVTYLAVGVASGGLALAAILPLILLIVTVLFIPLIVMASWIMFRWLAIITLTTAMPLIAVFWAVDAFPLGGFSRLAGKFANAYPGLLISGLPPAFVFRIIVEVNSFGVGGLIQTFMICALGPLVVYLQVVTIKWASGAAADANAAAGSAQKVSKAGRQVGKAGRRVNSSRTSKTDIEPVDERSVLDDLSELEVSRWLTDGDSVVHEGPDAEAVHETFGVGHERRLDPVDAYGMTLASVKALTGLDDETDDAVAALQREVEDSAARVEALTDESRRVRERSERLSGRVDELERRLDGMTADNPTTDDDEDDQ